MPRSKTILTLCAAGFLSLAAQALAEEPPPEATAIEFFEASVRPVLATHCHECHGAAKQEYGLRLDSRAAVLAGSDDGPVVVVGKPGDSPLVKAIRHEGDIHMPPKAKLADDEIAVIARWVEIGLPWPAGEVTSGPKKLTGDELYRHARANLWSLQPIARPQPPAVKDGAWASEPLDQFVQSKLEAAELTPSPAADPRTFLRRATFDLHGLPPTAEELAAFERRIAELEDEGRRERGEGREEDAAGGNFALRIPHPALEEVVDRLLASPRYGERWSRHWLDVARYADTRGYALGRERKFPYAYTYRDWVIRALNDDLPYDEFVRRQIAADKIEGLEPRELAALGFLTVGRKFDNAPDDIDDQIDTVARGLLGLTVSCARCHDHKYDAIPTHDYYSLYGVFASSSEPKDYPLIGPPQATAEYQAFEQELNKRQQAVEEYLSQRHAEIMDAARRTTTDYLVRVLTGRTESLLDKFPFLSLGPDELKPRLVERWQQYVGRDEAREHPVWKPLRALRDVPEDQLAARCGELQAAWEKLPPEQINAAVLQALRDAPPTSRIELAKRYGDLLSAAFNEWKQAGASDEARAKLPPPKQQLLEELLRDGTPTSIPRGDLREYLLRHEREKHRELEKAVQSHEASSPGAPPRAMSLVDRAELVNPVVFIRGQVSRHGDRVPRQFLRVVAGDERQPFTQGSGRLELANAIASPHNPLTARVIVNRVWLQHFGSPLVATPSDFGLRSEPPTHPELLDFLAGQFIDGGWSLKKLHRTIMLSAAYRQESNDRADCRAKDPENRLLWKMNRRRLEFEALRDSLLMVGGNLDATMFGRPEELFTNLSLRRRSVYGFVDRQDLPNVLRAFDFASPDQSAERRPQTTVPQQTLFMLNSPLVIQQAQALAARPDIAGQSGTPDRIAALYRILFQRPPSDEERAAGEAFLTSAEQTKSPDDKLDVWQQYAQLLLMTNEFMFVD